MRVPVVEELTYANGGWVRYLNRDLKATVFVRYVEAGGKLEPEDTFIAGQVDPRKVPWTRLSALVNSDDAVRRRLRLPGLDLRALVDLGGPLGHMDLVVPSARLPEHHRPYPESFYAAVAETYRSLVGRVRNPVGMLADANGVPLTTAKRWIRVARKRGLLAGGSRAQGQTCRMS